MMHGAPKCPCVLSMASIRSYILNAVIRVVSKRRLANLELTDAAITDILRSSPPKHDLFDMELIIRRSCGCQPAENPS